MKKRNIFSRQAVNFLWVLLGLGAGLQFIEVIWAASKGYLGFFSMMVVVVTEIVITGSIYVIIYKFLIKPCNETRKLFKHFIQSGSFQELIDQDYQIFPEQNEVMQKLDSILNVLHCKIRSIIIFCIIRWKQYEEMRYVKELIVLLIRRKHCLHFSDIPSRIQEIWFQ